MAYDYQTASLTAENTFTDWLAPIKKSPERSGYIDFFVTGTWAGTITVQKRYERSGVYTDPIDVEDYVANSAELIEDHVWGVEYRAGFKTGDYTSGTAVARLDR